MQKPKIAKETPQVDLQAQLTDYFDQVIALMLHEE